MSTSNIILIAHNLRSCYNVGSLLRTCDGLGINMMLCTGTTPTPKREKDARLPHIRERAHRQISKTALGAEESVSCRYFDDLNGALAYAREHGFKCIALEQTPDAVPLNKLPPVQQSVSLVVGPEVDGLDETEIAQCDRSVEIPMRGMKRSLNVSVAAAIALYVLKQ